MYLCFGLPESVPAVSRMSEILTKAEHLQSLAKHKKFGGFFGSTDKQGVTKSMKFMGEVGRAEFNQGNGQGLL